MKKYLVVTVTILLTLSTAVVAQQEETHKHRGRRGGGPMANLTEEQRTCLEGKIGTPGSGERPSREAMKQAFDDCGIEAPQRHPPRRGSESEEDSSVAS